MHPSTQPASGLEGPALPANPGAFHAPRRPNGLVCCPPPSCHIVAYCTGGLQNLFREISTKTQPKLHNYGAFTTSKGRFQPQSSMPLLALRYRFVKTLAEGQSCIVIKAMDTFRNNSVVSIKILHLNYCKLGTQEVDVIRQLNQADPYRFSSVLRLQNTFMFDDHFCLVFDHYNPQTLIEHVKTFTGKDRLEFVRKVAARLVLCLGFLQSQNVIHADLKIENILLADPNDASTVRVVDFGNAIHCVHNEMSLYYQDFELQTLLYRAPEVMYGLPFGTEVDLWSLGVVLAQLYMGRPFVLGKTKQAITGDLVKTLGHLPRKLFQRGKYYRLLEQFTQDSVQAEPVYRLMTKLCCTDYHFCDFISGLLQYDPKRRLTPQTAARHPFLAPVLGMGHLGGGYPPLALSGTSYKYSPLIPDELRRRHLPSLDLLREGTSAKHVEKTKQKPEVKHDRLEMLRNRNLRANDQVSMEVNPPDGAGHDDGEIKRKVGNGQAPMDSKLSVRNVQNGVDAHTERRSISDVRNNEKGAQFSNEVKTSDCKNGSYNNDVKMEMDVHYDVRKDSVTSREGRDVILSTSYSEMEADQSSNSSRATSSNVSSPTSQTPKRVHDDVMRTSRDDVINHPHDCDVTKGTYTVRVDRNANFQCDLTTEYSEPEVKKQRASVGKTSCNEQYHYQKSKSEIPKQLHEPPTEIPKMLSKTPKMKARNANTYEQRSDQISHKWRIEVDEKSENGHYLEEKSLENKYQRRNGDSSENQKSDPRYSNDRGNGRYRVENRTEDRRDYSHKNMVKRRDDFEAESDDSDDTNLLSQDSSVSSFKSVDRVMYRTRVPARDTSRETRDQSREPARPRDASHDRPREQQRDEREAHERRNLSYEKAKQPRDAPVFEPRDQSRGQYQSRDAPRGQSHDRSVDRSRSCDRSRDLSADQHSVEVTYDPPRGQSRDRSRDEYHTEHQRLGQYQTRDQSRDLLRDPLRDQSRDHPRDHSRELARPASSVPSSTSVHSVHSGPVSSQSSPPELQGRSRDPAPQPRDHTRVPRDLGRLAPRDQNFHSPARVSHSRQTPLRSEPRDAQPRATCHLPAKKRPLPPESLVSGIVRSTPMIKLPERPTVSMDPHLPNFGNISPIDTSNETRTPVPDSRCKKSLPFHDPDSKHRSVQPQPPSESKTSKPRTKTPKSNKTKTPKSDSNKRKRSTGAQREVESNKRRMGDKTQFITDVFGTDIYEFTDSPCKL